MLVSTNTLKRFLIDSILSSARPDVSPRCKRRLSMTSSGASKKRVNLEGTTERSKAWAWSSLRGKPVVELVIAYLCLSCLQHTVNEEQALVLGLHRRLHGILQQLDGNLHRHNRTLLDVRLDHLTKLAPRTILLLTKQVACAQLLKAIVRDKLHALRSLACTRVTQ